MRVVVAPDEDALQRQNEPLQPCSHRRNLRAAAGSVAVIAREEASSILTGLAGMLVRHTEEAMRYRA